MPDSTVFKSVPSLCARLLFGDKLVGLLCALIGVLTLSIFISNWDIDEGVISLFTDYFQKTGDLRYLFQHHNARFSFSWPYFYILALVRGDALDPNTYFLLRVPSLVLCTLSLVAVNECLKALSPSRAVRALAMIFFVACCLQLGATHARYDSPYMFGAAIALLSAVRLHQGRSWSWACPGLLAAAFGGTTHPVGLGAVGFMGVVLLYFVIARRPTRREAAIVAGVGVASAVFLVAGLLMGRSPTEFLEDLKGVQDKYHTFTSNTFFDERYRYLSVLQTWGLLAKLFVSGLFLGLVWPAFGEHRQGIRCLRLGLWTLVIFLAFIPTKWPYYLGSLLPCATVLGAYHMSALACMPVFSWNRVGNALSRRFSFCVRTLANTAAIALAVYLAIKIGRDGWVSAHTNTLFARLARPSGKQATLSSELAQYLAGKSINLYSDMTIVPLLGTADFSRHCRRQPDADIGEEADLADSGEYLIVSDRHRAITYGYVERHSQVSRFPPEKLTDVCFFNDTFTVYRIHQNATKKAGLNEQAQTRLHSDAGLQ
jgi:hypothetical protein